MTKKVKDHFKKVDPVLYEYIVKVGEIRQTKVENLFEDLCSSIIGQQLSGKVADTIFARFKALFPNGEITSKRILKLNAALQGRGIANSCVYLQKGKQNLLLLIDHD